jgi:DNA helicase II / ATP-dependent DNA helicase PcrA
MYPQIVNKTEPEEREYLELIKERLLLAIDRSDNQVKQFSEELRNNKEYIYENQSSMDEADMVSADQSINRMAFTGDSAVARKHRLMKLLGSPYFGRIDFVDGKNERKVIYIGVHTFTDEQSQATLIYDWRAPVSSMFYDFELGEASYTTPTGRVDGRIDFKRQFKIREGKMEFSIENEVNIHDDLLQKELSKSADDRMKNIVATIQRDQNTVIRNETASIMVIQGVAGSGKTSIALHRIAFLLYRFRDTITSNDVLIISPNRVFSDYISNVLPELGEEHIPVLGMEDLASEIIENKFRFEPFFAQVAKVVENRDLAYIERIRLKSSFEFLSQLNRFLIFAENYFFNARELRVAGVVVPAPFIQERFKAWQRMPMMKRFPEVVKEVLNFIRNKQSRKLTGQEKSIVWQEIPRMFKAKSVLDVYREFYTWWGKPEAFKYSEGSLLEYADVFPFIYCKVRMEGVKTYDTVKHLLVDEMQDYTPVQYSVLSRLFVCKKTILGDVRQVVNPYSSSTLETIEKVFPQAEILELQRSYRSTIEIVNFSLQILPNEKLIPLQRHGEAPEIIGCVSNEEELIRIRERLSILKSKGYRSFGIICKTARQAEYVFNNLQLSGSVLLTPQSTRFKEGVVITTVHLAKGLEFDAVFVPFVSLQNYTNSVDKSLLYIACTRAMHHLMLTYTSKKSNCI